MNTSPTISVIVPTYNRDHALLDCLSSVLAQEYGGRAEVIVVDQSRARGPEVQEFFSCHSGEITRVIQEEPNLPKARNRGAQAASNELLVFVDDDMELASGALAKLAGHLTPASRRAVAGLPVSDKAPESSFREYARLYGERIRDLKSDLIEHAYYIPAPCCISADLYRQLGGFDENLGKLSPTAYGEDDDFWFRAGRAGVRLFIDPALRVAHRDHLAGGCESRHTDPALARKYHMKSLAYMRIKRHGSMGAGGWLQLARGYLVNREILRSGPRQILRNFITARKAVAEVRVFMAGRTASCSGAL
jgi:GT2 family glycosyltransferase